MNVIESSENERDLEMARFIEYFKRNNIKLVYCPNEALGLSGPFMELENVDQVNYAIAYDKIKEVDSIANESDVMISEVNNG